MGLLVDGKWQDRWYDTSKSGQRGRGQVLQGDAARVQQDRGETRRTHVGRTAK